MVIHAKTFSPPPPLPCHFLILYHLGINTHSFPICPLFLEGKGSSGSHSSYPGHGRLRQEQLTLVGKALGGTTGSASSRIHFLCYLRKRGDSRKEDVCDSLHEAEGH